jgi:lipid-A-disaccharide synthase
VKILISAAEASSDTHGAELLKAIREQLDVIDAFGIGGPKLQAQGLRTIIDARELLVMGFLEVMSRLPKIFNALNRIATVALEEKPDIAVLIDYPEFHFKLAKRLKQSGIPIVYYIPPKVWVWRKGRVKFLREFFCKVLCIFPFEEDFYRSQNISAKYVGNPLLDELPFQLTRTQARKDLGLGTNDRAIVLMPGSRPAEIRRHLELMLDSCVRSAAHLRAKGGLGEEQQLKVLIPIPETSNFEDVQSTLMEWLNRYSGKSAFILDVQLHKGNSWVCMIAADVGLIKSGTSTLEAGLLGCPHVVVYKPNFVTEFIFKYIVKYKGPVGMVNLVHGGIQENKNHCVVKEIVCSDATVESLSTELRKLFLDQDYVSKMREGFAKIKDVVTGNGSQFSPSKQAAKEIIEVLQCR